MTPTYHQVGCFEGKDIDLAQANAVLELRPDIILFEYPNNKNTPDMVVNNYVHDEKPLAEIEKMKKQIEAVSDIHPWAKSDIFLYDNVMKLWNEGVNTLLYTIDSPSELTSTAFTTFEEHIPSAEPEGVNFCWWAHQFVRAHDMHNNLNYVLSNTKHENPVVLACIEKIHWDHVMFLQGNPSNEERWDYFFGAFKDKGLINHKEYISTCNPVLQKYWDALADSIKL